MCNISLSSCLLGEEETIFYTVFSWGEFSGMKKHREENRVEISVFHCLAKE